MTDGDGDDMAEHDGDHRQVPRKTRIDDANVRSVMRRAQEVPAETERIRTQADDQLALDQQVGEVVR